MAPTGRQGHNDDNLLHATAREAAQLGELPRQSPDKVWGGPATGARCAVCGKATTIGEVELELEFTSDSATSRTSYRVHPRCFSTFSLELERASGTKPSPRPPDC